MNNRMMTITNLDICASLIKSVDAQLDTNKCVRSRDTFKDLGIDSMELLCIICDIETEYNIDISDDAISINNTIEEATNIIFCLILNKA